MKPFRVRFLLFIILILFLPARIAITDEINYFSMAVNLFEQGRPVATTDGVENYSRFPVFYPLLLSPYLAAVKTTGRVWYRIFADDRAGLLNWGMILCFNIVVTFGIFQLLCRRFMLAPGPAGLPPSLAALVIISTMLLFYSGTLFTEPLQALLLLAALGFTDRHRRWILASLALAGLVLIKPVNLIYLPVFLLAAAYSSRSWKTVLVMTALGALIPLLMHGIYNYMIRGSAADFGYAPVYFDCLTNRWTPQGFSHSIIRGMTGFLFSPGKSFILYNPLCLLGLAGLWRGIRDRDLTAGLALIVILQTFLLYAGWSQWEGGLCYGPRFLVTIIPVTALGFVYLGKRLRRPEMLAAIMVLGLLGFFIHVMARVVPLYAIYIEHGYGTGFSYDLTYNYFGAMLPGLKAVMADSTVSPLLLMQVLPPVVAGLLLFTAIIIYIIFVRDWLRDMKAENG